MCWDNKLIISVINIWIVKYLDEIAYLKLRVLQTSPLAKNGEIGTFIKSGFANWSQFYKKEQGIFI